jgi:hypothetical protein
VWQVRFAALCSTGFSSFSSSSYTSSSSSSASPYNVNTGLSSLERLQASNAGFSL